MSQISYCVFTTFDDPALADEWLRWLREGHVAEVMAGGATDAEIVEVDGAAPGGRSFEVRYHFASRQGFERYEKDHAPRLRAEGLQLFPVERGVAYRRSTGVVVARFPTNS